MCIYSIVHTFLGNHAFIAFEVLHHLEHSGQHCFFAYIADCSKIRYAMLPFYFTYLIQQDLSVLINEARQHMQII